MPSEGGKRLAQLYSDLQALRDRVQKETNKKVRERMKYVIDRLESDIVRSERVFGPRLMFWKKDAHRHQIAEMNKYRLEGLVRMYEDLSKDAANYTAQQEMGPPVQQVTRPHQRLEDPIMSRYSVEQFRNTPSPTSGLAAPRLATTISNISMRDSYEPQTGYPLQPHNSNFRSRSEYDVSGQYIGHHHHQREPSEQFAYPSLQPNPNVRHAMPNNDNWNTQPHHSALAGPGPRNSSASNNNPHSTTGRHRRQDTGVSLIFGRPAPSEQSHYFNLNAASHATESGFGNQPINRSIDHHRVARPDSFGSYPASGERVSSTGTYGSSGPGRASEGSSSRGFSTSGSSNGGGSRVSQEQWENPSDDEDLYVTSEEFHGSHRNRTSSSQHPQGGPGGHFPQQ